MKISIIRGIGIRKWILPFYLFTFLPLHAENLSVSSPNGQLVVTVSETDGNITYAATLNGQPVITPSALGLKTNIATFTENLSILPPNPPSFARPKDACYQRDARIFNFQFSIFNLQRSIPNAWHEGLKSQLPSQPTDR